MHPMTLPDRLMSVREVAAWANLSTDMIYAEIKAGRLAAIVVSKRGDYRIEPDSLLAWLASLR